MKDEAWLHIPGGAEASTPPAVEQPAPRTREASAIGRTSSVRRGSFFQFHPLAMDRCEAIQTGLWLSHGEGDSKNVTVFVGASRGCGASTVASNFAGALARNPESRVLLIDFAAPRAQRAPLQRNPDLNAWLENRSEPDGAPQEPARLYRLSSESLGRMVFQVVQSCAFDEFLVRARKGFDHVVIDAPSLQDHPESLVLCRKSDSVVLVVRAGKTRSETALWACEQIDRAHGHLAGVVLNRYRRYVPKWLSPSG